MLRKLCDLMILFKRPLKKESKCPSFEEFPGLPPHLREGMTEGEAKVWRAMRKRARRYGK